MFSDMQLLDVVSVVAVWLFGAGLLQADIFEAHQQPQANTFFLKGYCPFYIWSFIC